jgi:hypothetical protein
MSSTKSSRRRLAMVVTLLLAFGVGCGNEHIAPTAPEMHGPIWVHPVGWTVGNPAATRADTLVSPCSTERCLARPFDEVLVLQHPRGDRR